MIYWHDNTNRAIYWHETGIGRRDHARIIESLQSWFHYWYHSGMAAHWKILDQMRREPANVRFSDLKKVCEEYFGKPRQTGTSHMIFKTPWSGDPRINIQDDKGKAKVYQVRQVLLAIEKLEGIRHDR